MDILFLASLVQGGLILDQLQIGAMKHDLKLDTPEPFFPEGLGRPGRKLGNAPLWPSPPSFLFGLV